MKSKRHTAETSRISHDDVKGTDRIFNDTETVFRVVERYWPVTGLQIHIRTGLPHHEVFARLGDLRKQGRIVDSDEFIFLCPKTKEAHTCCEDQRSGLRLRKTFPPSPDPAAEAERYFAERDRFDAAMGGDPDEIREEYEWLQEHARERARLARAAQPPVDDISEEEVPF